MSSDTNDKDYGYTVTMSSTEDNFIISDSLRGYLPEDIFSNNNSELSNDFETQVCLAHDNNSYVGKLISFELQNSQSTLCFELKKTEAIQFIDGKRFDTVTIKHADTELWSAEEVPKLKDTVSVDLNNSEAIVTLIIRKIAYTERHK